MKKLKRWKRLHDIMLDRRCTASRLSRLTCISRGIINSFLDGRRLPRPETMNVLSSALMCSLEELLELAPIKRMDTNYHPSYYDLPYIQSVCSKDVGPQIHRVLRYIEKLEKFGG